MPTKAELEAENVSLERKLTRAKNKIAKMKDEASEAPTSGAGTPTLVEAVEVLVASITKKGLDNQVGQKELRHVCEAMDARYHAHVSQEHRKKPQDEE